MPGVETLSVKTDDGVALHAEVTGRGTPVLFLHEFSGNHRSWEQQVRALGGRYCCITFSARGFLPSDVPVEAEAYSQERAVADAVAVLDATGVEAAHVVGLSMGGFTALNLALDHPERVRAAVVGSCGYGAEVDQAEFRAEMEALAALFREKGSRHMAELSASSPYRLALKHKDPRAFAEWVEALGEHDPVGAANTILGVQANRPTLRELAARMGSLQVPVLFVTGDEDDPCLEANLLAKRSSPLAGLAVLPRTAHTLNLEAPMAFNSLLLDYFAQVDASRWEPRDPRSIRESGGWVR